MVETCTDQSSSSDSTSRIDHGPAKASPARFRMDRVKAFAVVAAAVAVHVRSGLYFVGRTQHFASHGTDAMHLDLSALWTRFPHMARLAAVSGSSGLLAFPCLLFLQTVVAVLKMLDGSVQISWRTLFCCLPGCSTHLFQTYYAIAYRRSLQQGQSRRLVAVAARRGREAWVNRTPWGTWAMWETILYASVGIELYHRAVLPLAVRLRELNSIRSIVKHILYTFATTSHVLYSAAASAIFASYINIVSRVLQGRLIRERLEMTFASNRWAVSKLAGYGPIIERLQQFSPRTRGISDGGNLLNRIGDQWNDLDSQFTAHVALLGTTALSYVALLSPEQMAALLRFDWPPGLSLPVSILFDGARRAFVVALTLYEARVLQGGVSSLASTLVEQKWELLLQRARGEDVSALIDLVDAAHQNITWQTKVRLRSQTFGKTMFAAVLQFILPIVAIGKVASLRNVFIRQRALGQGR
eukprot:TRINITY_DN46433_c0_g1_i1.p1 TRINITY_DN46433_c0_g1~~TRINITY_DN46433_c0_g1_i1.p1  ORF type:complete len:483 (+),score=39.41 TRINITY_DN46433_c0_g1_i1:40-1449(+)